MPAHLDIRRVIIDPAGVSMGGMDAARSGRGLARRLAICVAGMIVLSAGVLLNTMTGLGTSVMNTFPYAVDA